MPARNNQKINTPANRQKWRQFGVQQAQNGPKRLSYHTFESQLHKLRNLSNEQKLEVMNGLMPTVSRMFRDSSRQGHTIRSLKFKNMMYEEGNFDTILPNQTTISPVILERVNRLEREVSDSRELIKALRNQAQEAAKQRKDGKSEVEERGMTCTICYEPFVKDQVMATSPGPCTSFYCLSCLHTVIEYHRRTNSSSSSTIFDCPCCRKPCNKYLTIKYNKENVIDLEEEDSPDENDLEIAAVAESCNVDTEEIRSLAPDCDKCRVLMILKTSRTGNKFYSCPNWKVTKCPGKSFYD